MEDAFAELHRVGENRARRRKPARAAAR
jgi:hypothetical protein